MEDSDKISWIDKNVLKHALVNVNVIYVNWDEG